LNEVEAMRKANKSKCAVEVLTEDGIADLSDDSPVPIENTAFWKKMEENRTGNLLAAARLKAGLTQVQLAGKLKIHQSIISDYERGRRTPSAATLARFCRVLGVNEEYFSA
jgi:ribosome-binding protein aMBF1 (putative translation factor)